MTNCIEKITKRLDLLEDFPLIYFPWGVIIRLIFLLALPFNFRRIERACYFNSYLFFCFMFVAFFFRSSVLILVFSLGGWHRGLGLLDHGFLGVPFFFFGIKILGSWKALNHEQFRCPNEMHNCTIHILCLRPPIGWSSNDLNGFHQFSYC